MKSVIQLVNAEKAKFLFELLPDEIPLFIDSLKDKTNYLLHDADQLKNEWKGQFISYETWVQLAEKAQQVVLKYGDKLGKNSRLFADQLFDGYIGIYSIHLLNEYILYQEFKNQKFFYAVQLLFGVYPPKQSFFKKDAPVDTVPFSSKLISHLNFPFLQEEVAAIYSSRGMTIITLHSGSTFMIKIQAAQPNDQKEV
jgi:hypothetical protein